MQWLDKRQPITSALVDLDRVEGVLCNVVTSNLLSALWQQRHWFAIRKVGQSCETLTYHSSWC